MLFPFNGDEKIMLMNELLEREPHSIRMPKKTFPAPFAGKTPLILTEDADWCK
jgi:hypothetical protein